MPEWSQSAYRHSEYVAKYGVFYLDKEQKKLDKTFIKEDDPINIIFQEVHNKVTYRFCTQLLQNLKE